MDSNIISIYTRKQAIADGVLKDITAFAKEAGIKYPTAITNGVEQILKETTDIPDLCQDYQGRLWDLLTIFRLEAKRATGDEIHFSPLFVMKDGKTHQISMWSKIGPGDTANPVITIMLKGED